MARKSAQGIVIVLSFLIVIGAPLMASLSGVELSSPDENRRLAPPPDLARKFNLRRFTDQFDRYYQDNFGLRPLFINVYRSIFHRGLGADAMVLRGEDSWLFLAKGIQGDRAKNIPVVQDLCGLAPFGKEELELWVAALTENYRRLAEVGIHYVWMPVPNKHTIYAERLPARYRCPSERKTRLEQLVSRLRAEGVVPIVDLRAQFRRRADAGERLYFKTDSHWNPSGMLLGYSALMNALPSDLRFRDVVAEDGVKRFQERLETGDLVRLLGTGEALGEGFESMRFSSSAQRIDQKADRRNPRDRTEIWSTNNSALSNAMFIHNSFFAMKIKQLLTDSFNVSTFIRVDRPLVDFDAVVKRRPRIVVHQMVERTLLNDLFRLGQ